MKLSNVNLIFGKYLGVVATGTKELVAKEDANSKNSSESYCYWSR